MVLPALARACHPLPTAAMTVVITVIGWSVGWRLPAILGVTAAVLLGQLSVGWSNDAIDAGHDRAAGRAEKPTVRGEVSPRTLAVLACVALLASAVTSWWVAGLLGGTFHVVAVLLAWAYNAGLSRTAWSWVPYLLAFACVPPFLTLGLDRTAPPAWLVVVFAAVGVSAHIANALPDVESDRAAGLGGAVVAWGARRSALVAWVLLGASTAVLALVASTPVLVAWVLLGYVAALVLAARSSSADALFHALLLAVAVDLVAIVATA